MDDSACSVEVAMPVGTTSGPAAGVLLLAALTGGLSAFLGAVLDVQGIEQAADLAKDGVIWTGGTPVMYCIAGAVGGSIFSVGWELMTQRGAFPTWKMAIKLFIQPILAVVCAPPIIHWMKLPFSGEVILFVSFVVGAAGVPIVKMGIPMFEQRIMPLFVKRISKDIDP